MKKIALTEPLTEQARAAAELLERLAFDWALLDQLPADVREKLHKAVAGLMDPNHRARRRRAKAQAREDRAQTRHRQDAVLNETGIRTLRRRPLVTTPNVFPPEHFQEQTSAGAADTDTGSAGERHCYVCKSKYSQLHAFYDQLCPKCGDDNLAARTELADLRGRVALLTGGRVKIGYHAGLKLLRSGAHLIVTTRFPRNAAARYAEEPDFADWAHRLEIFGLDLRHTPSVEAFCKDLVSSRARLDFIINNACQTVRRPPDFYAHMMAAETAALRDMPAHVRALLGDGDSDRSAASLPALSSVAVSSAALSMVPLLPDELMSRPDLFPEGRLDADRQQVDLRGMNSWRMLLADVPTVEFLEVQLVNAIAPFIFNARLKPLMLRVPGRDKHIVNVSAVEGQFYRIAKTTRHPHTNMAKAALNMMTRTAATDYYNDGIHMNSVDTGWITDEQPNGARAPGRELALPLDAVDGAARICDPVFRSALGEFVGFGQFLKDYRPVAW